MSNYKPVFRPLRTESVTFSPIPSRPYMPERADGEIEWVLSDNENDNLPKAKAWPHSLKRPMQTRTEYP